MALHDDAPLIDLIEAGRKFPSRVGFRVFGQEIVLMADALVTPHTPAPELVGIERCLLHLLRRLSWRGRIGILPAPFPTHYGQRGIWPTPHDELVVRSLTGTVLHYRASLYESVSALRSVLLAELIQGVEWACDAAERGVKLEIEAEIPRLPR